MFRIAREPLERSAVRLLGAGGMALLPLVAAGQGTPEAWVGCWTLEHREDWAPTIAQQGFPTGAQAPAPRMLLLDRLPGLRSNLQGAPSAPTFRAEWVGTALRGTEAWALRADGNVYVENVPGGRVISVLLEGPPAESVAPAMWFFRRTDTPLPEIRSLVTARKVRCPAGREPHVQVERGDLEERLTSIGVEGSFVLYHQAERRIIRVNPAGDRGLPLEPGGRRTTAWSQVATLVDGIGAASDGLPRLERGGDPASGTRWITGSERTPEGALVGWALHLHGIPPSWIEEEEAEALKDLARGLAEAVLGR